MVVGILICPLIHSMCDLKAEQMNVSCYLIYKFEVGQNATEENKNICCVKSDGTVNRNIVIRWSMRFSSGWKNLGNEVK